MKDLKLDCYKLAKKYVNSHKKYINLFDDVDDYIMELTYSLISKLDKYDNNKSSLGTFAYLIFNNVINRQLCLKEKNNYISIDIPLYDDSDLTLKDILPDEHDYINDYINCYVYNDLFNNLKQIIKPEYILHYAYNLSYEDIAKKLHKSRQNIKQKIDAEKYIIDSILNNEIMCYSKFKNLKKLKLINELKEIQKDRILY